MTLVSLALAARRYTPGLRVEWAWLRQEEREGKTLSAPWCVRCGQAYAEPRRPDLHPTPQRRRAGALNHTQRRPGTTQGAVLHHPGASTAPRGCLLHRLTGTAADPELSTSSRSRVHATAASLSPPGWAPRCTFAADSFFARPSTHPDSERVPGSAIARAGEGSR